MSRKTNIPKKRIRKSYGIQPYRLCNKGYPGVIRTPTFFAANCATVIRESEYAKPYDESEDYSGMEYAAPNWPGIDWLGVDRYGIDYPDMPDKYDPWHMNFRCNIDPCWCEGETKTFVAGCTYEIADARFVPLEGDLSVTFTKNTVSITAATGIRSGESGYLTITMKAYVPKGGTLWQGKYDPVYGTHSSISVGECETGCCDDSGISWDSDTSAGTIQRYFDCVVAIKDSLGSGGPYTWSVSGTGYSLDYSETTGLLNTLNADGTACNPAIITVTGCDGKEVEGEVWCASGSWVNKYLCDNCNLAHCTNIIAECCCFWVDQDVDPIERKQSYMHCCKPGSSCNNYCGVYGWWEGGCENTDPACTKSLGAYCGTMGSTDCYWTSCSGRRDEWECT